MKRVIMLVGVVTVAAAPVDAVGQLETRASAERQEECRRAAVVLEARAPLPQEALERTLGEIRRCDISGGRALAAAWATPAYHENIGALMLPSWEIHDRRILEAVLEGARSPTWSEEARLGALGVMAEYLRPKFRPRPERLYTHEDQEWPHATGLFSHAAWWPGAEPLDEADRVRIVHALEEIEASTPEIRISRAAQFILGVARHSGAIPLS